MSLKIKLISCISAFILVLSMLFVGVFAAQNVQLNVGGNVSFTASSVYAKVTGSYVGTKEQPSTAKQLTQINIDADTTDGAVSMPDDWTSMPLNFDESGSNITVTITIENLASDRAIAVSLTDNTNITGVNVARAYNSASFEGNTSSQTISGGESGTFTFTLSLASKNNDISDAFDLDINLANSSTTAQTYKATISNTSPYTLYAMGDDGQIQTINSSGSLELQTSKVSFAFSSSYLTQTNSLNSKVLNGLIIEDVELYAPDLGIDPSMSINGEFVAFYYRNADQWGGINSDFQVSIDSSAHVLTYTLDDDTEFIFVMTRRIP